MPDLVLMTIDADDGHIVCMLAPPPGYTHQHYGLVVADLLRHIANAYGVSVEDVLPWVNKEPDNPTSPIEGWRVQ
jgi:hypothetical protein